MGKYKEIGKSIKDYTASRETRDLRDDQATAIVKMPIKVGERVFQISDLPSLADLPPMPERQRDFAYRRGTEYKTDEEWAKLFGVSRTTIHRWKAKPEISQLTALTKYEQRSYLHGMMIRLGRKTLMKLDEMLNVKVKADTMAPLLATIKFIYSDVLGQSVSTESSDDKRAFNVNIGMAPGTRYGDQVSTPSPFSAVRDVTPQQLEKAEYDIKRATAIIKHFKGDIEQGGNGDNGNK